MEKGSWWEPFECLHNLFTIPEVEQGSRKVQCSPPGGRASYPGLFQVAKQTHRAEAEKQVLLTGYHQLILVESSVSLGISIDFVLKSKEFTPFCNDLETGSQEEWQSNAKSRPDVIP